MKKRNVALVLVATMMLSLAGYAGSNEKTEDTKNAQTETENKTEEKEDAVQIDGALSIYCGAGMQQPFQEIAVEEFVTSSEDLVKHIPVLVVKGGNKKNIQGLNDLARKDVVTVIGDPESTPIGKIAKKAFADFQIVEKVTIAATTTTAPQLATIVGLGEADAAIIWKENAKASQEGNH